LNTPKIKFIILWQLAEFLFAFRSAEFVICKCARKVHTLCTHPKLLQRKADNSKSPKMKKPKKRARGYRLFPQTQKQIAKIQKLLNADSDKAIAAACSFFLKEHSEVKDKSKILITNL
jgi:hypothetical protein